MEEAARRAIEAVRRRARPGRLEAVGVDVHFHPDAVGDDAASALAGIGTARRWRTQFETGTSNGGLTARPGGDRWRWESRLFDGAYDGVPPRARPAYGALGTGDPRGAAPRFGSAHLHLAPAVLGRTTFCHPDSAHEPEAVGTVDAAGAVLDSLARLVLEDPLDRYVEAHVHGGVALDDVETVVLDPSFRGTATEEAAGALGVPVRWHPGFVLHEQRLGEAESYRGPDAVRAARRLLVDGVLTPALLGAARRGGEVDEPTAKHVWHLLAGFGRC